jgi:hypothetical protein
VRRGAVEAPPLRCAQPQPGGSPGRATACRATGWPAPRLPRDRVAPVVGPGAVELGGRLGEHLESGGGRRAAVAGQAAASLKLCMASSCEPPASKRPAKRADSGPTGRHSFKLVPHAKPVTVDSVDNRAAVESESEPDPGRTRMRRRRSNRRVGPRLWPQLHGPTTNPSPYQAQPALSPSQVHRAAQCSLPQK